MIINISLVRFSVLSPSDMRGEETFIVSSPHVLPNGGVFASLFQANYDLLAFLQINEEIIDYGAKKREL